MAIADHDKAIQLNPNLPDAYNFRGLAYKGKGDYNRAIADYSDAMRLNPKYAAAYINRGDLYKNKGDYDRAIADYEAALRINPNLKKASDSLSHAKLLMSPEYQLGKRVGEWVGEWIKGRKRK
jgi:tetratricopeptide (TPR) repeat protein